MDRASLSLATKAPASGEQARAGCFLSTSVACLQHRRASDGRICAFSRQRTRRGIRHPNLQPHSEERKASQGRLASIWTLLSASLSTLKSSWSAQRTRCSPRPFPLHHHRRRSQRPALLSSPCLCPCSSFGARGHPRDTLRRFHHPSLSSLSYSSSAWSSNRRHRSYSRLRHHSYNRPGDALCGASCFASSPLGHRYEPECRSSQS